MRNAYRLFAYDTLPNRRAAWLLLLLVGLTGIATAQVRPPVRTTRPSTPTTSITPADSLRQVARDRVRDRADSLRAARSASRRPTVNWPDRYISRLSGRVSRSPFILRDPKTLGTNVRIGDGGQVLIDERLRSTLAPPGTPGGAVPTTTPGTAPAPVGAYLPPSIYGLPFRAGESVPFSIYNSLQNSRLRDNVWKEYSSRRDGQSALTGRGLIPKIDLPPGIDRLFGPGGVDFKPNGFVTLDLGYLYQFIDNPTIPVQQRRQGNLIFNEQISVNMNGKIGDKLGVLFNYDTKASFNFENALKVQYKPFGANTPSLGSLSNPGSLAGNLPGVTPGALNLPTRPGLPSYLPQTESIIQGVEAGNFGWTLNSQLIPGVQNLFGAKVQLRFGRLTATVVASQQRSKQAELVLQGGTVTKPFEIRADGYDENRHFFLSQFFRNNYERSLKSLPVVTSGVNVTRIEVYVTNRTNTTDALRNIAGFADLAEPSPYRTGNPNVQPVAGATVEDNATNSLFSKLRADANLRNVDQTNSELNGNFGFAQGVDYDLLRGAKRLTDREFKLNQELGYISLVTPLRNDEVLAVSYEYTLNGRAYRVGELTEDYQNQALDKVIYLKLLKSSTIRNNLQLPMWNLMMKNIYSLNTNTLAKQNFQLRIIYKDDVTGIDNPTLQESSLAGKPLVRVFNADQLNAQLDKQPDGNYDYVENVTINSVQGKVIFPVLEPFGSYLSKQFKNDGSDDVYRSKYVFGQLYTGTLSDAQQITDKNKFFLKGVFQAGTGQEISLPFGVNAASVQVSAGGVPLTSGIDYSLDGQSGRLRIINESILNSGREIRIRYEMPDLFQNQIRTLLGTRLDYALGPGVNLGFTAMKMTETPAGFLTRVAIGNEPVDNLILGADANIRQDVPGLTRLLDRLPLIQTKEPSVIQAQAEVAQLIPGVTPTTNGNSFIDDFEGARTIYDLTRQPTRWRLGATPQQFTQGSVTDPLPSAYNRARMSVYSVDRTLYEGGSGSVQTNLTDDDLKNVYERYFLPTQLFPGLSAQTVQLPQNILDVSYFPSERGQYNYNTDLTNDGKLQNPTQNFGSVTRAVGSDIDFDNVNVQNITFWLMDPFVNDPKYGAVRGSANPADNKPNTTGGKLVFNLGDISEDVVKDERYNFENGLPVPGETRDIKLDTTAWGRVTKRQFVTNAFTNQTGARAVQDIGLDGLTNTEEQTFFKKYLDALRPKLSAAAFQQIAADPSGDDFRFYLGEQADSVRYVIGRYKQYMGMENNSPENGGGNDYLTPSSNNLPDVEDLNNDNTINTNEAYYEYIADLKPGQLVVGQNHIVDKVNVGADGVSGGVNWYQFRIPVREFNKAVGGINGFKSIRFIRMYLTGFAEPVVLRFGQLQLEAEQYRAYTGDLSAQGLQEVPEPYDANLQVSTVNIEENGQGTASKYVYTLPPGFQRDRDYTQINTVQLNEQSMSLAVTNLRSGDSRGAFKTTNFNLLFRKRLQMFVHMHNDQNESGRASAFIRLGTDFINHYYEIEIPNLVATPQGTNDPLQVWPSQNELDLALDELITLKANRNRQFTRQSGLPYTEMSSDGRYKLTVLGNPDLSSVQTVMLGVRNPKPSIQQPDQLPRSFTVWFDELRANGYDQHGGQAALGSVNAKLADIATVQASGRYTTWGFGSVQSKIGDRTRDNTSEFSIASTIQVDKLLPASWGLRIPLYVNYDLRSVVPHFNPLDPDTPLDVTLSTLASPAERARYRRLVEDNTVRNGFNFSNVRKVRLNSATKARFYDIENFSFSYAQNSSLRTNIQTDAYIQQFNKGGIAYIFSSQPKPFEPFRNVRSLERAWLIWLKDFNLTLLPTSVAIRTDMTRSFTKTQLLGPDQTTVGIDPQYEKYFYFNRYYNLTFNLTKSLVMTYGATANAIIDEPIGDINNQVKRDSVWRNVWKGGRIKNFQQDIRFTYRIPLDKIPALDWIAADALYNIGYSFQANSYGLVDSLGVSFGNTIRNTRERGVTGRVDLIRLYNKIRYLRFVNSPTPVRKNFTRNPGDVEDIQRGQSELLKNFTRTLLTVRGINFSYTVQEQTILPGFLPSPSCFGLSSGGGAPGWGFVLGEQDHTIQKRAAANGWLSPSTVQNTAFQQSITKKFTASTTLEPFKDFRMVINWRLDRTDSYQEYYRPATPGGPFESQSAVRNGQFSMSFWSFRTAFVGIRSDNSSPIFDLFESYRDILVKRLTAANSSKEFAYTRNSQDVLIPAFFAAYSGSDPNKTNFSPFYNFPLPNWEVNYNGLSNLPMFKKTFTSFNIRHSYNSTYSVGNFTSSLDYGSLYVNLAVTGYPTAVFGNADGQFVPVFVASTITMQERFAPMLGINFQTKNRVSARLEYNQARSAALNLSNAQVAELTDRDLTGSIGWTGKNFKGPFMRKPLKNDLTFNVQLTMRDQRSIQRKLDAEYVITAGNVNFQLRPTVNYVVNKRMNINFYFDRTFNQPLVSNSFIRATTSGGIQVKFNLAP